MNYLEHEIKVKYVDSLLAHSQEWQWFIEEVERNFDIKEIISWDDFLREIAPSTNVFTYFIKILGVCNKGWLFSKAIFKELWFIARYFIGDITIEECKNEIQTQRNKTMLLCVWITKLNNISNHMDYIFHIDVLRYHNCHELLKLNDIQDSEPLIMDYANSITLDGIEQPIKCLEDNLKAVQYTYSQDFFDRYEENFLNYNAFSCQFPQKPLYATWQENCLLDILNISVRDKAPALASEGTQKNTHEVEPWTLDILKNMKGFFQHKYADFIIDTVMYVKYDIEPTQETKLLHCEFLSQALKNRVHSFQIYTSSSYLIISFLFQDRMFQNCTKEERFIDLLKLIQSSTDIDFIKHVKESNIPISKLQNKSLMEYYSNKHKEIDSVNSIQALDEYLQDEDTPHLIDTEHLRKVSEKFNSYIDGDSNIQVSSLFYNYMLFLIRANEKSDKLDVRLVYSEMIRIQQLWENEYYSKQCDKLHMFSKDMRIPEEHIHTFNDLVLENPILFAKYCIVCNEDAILTVMVDTSECALLYMVDRLDLNPAFPTKTYKTKFERHDVDKMLLSYVDHLIKQKGYKLLNVLEKEVYVQSLHEEYQTKTQLYVSLFIKEKELYEIIRNSTKIELLPYSDDLNLAFLTQLFPILEMKIRELATLLGIFPYKKSEKEFMVANDPSSLLREVIQGIYNEQFCFDNIPDLLYVYHMMYNSNSLNIRNECIHGRAYLCGNGLRFAFKTTLFAIYMITFRIKTIQDNVSDLTEKADTKNKNP